VLHKRAMLHKDARLACGRSVGEEKSTKRLARCLTVVRALSNSRIIRYFGGVIG
jgi:hypothetical protein